MQGGELFPLDLGNEFAHRKLVRLQREVSLAVGGLDDVARGEATVIGGHALSGNKTRQQAECQDVGEPRRQCRPPRAERCEGAVRAVVPAGLSRP